MEQMMGQIHVWQMVVDLFLVSAILIFTFRWVKGDRAQALMPRTLELESSLRSLILEADGAGRHLNDQLLKREQSLQKLLDEITAADQKIQRAVAAGEERATALEKEERKARDLIGELQGVLLEFREQLASDADSVETAAPPPPRKNVRAQRDHDLIDDEFELERATPTQPIAPQTPPIQSPKAGQRIPQGYPQNPPTTAGTSAAMPKVYRDKMGHQELQQVYAAAESMLKQGQELSQVSAQTRLPVEEVQLLSQMIEIESEELQRSAAKAPKVATQPSDTRLGALGAIRRHNATL